MHRRDFLALLGMAIIGQFGRILQRGLIPYNGSQGGTSSQKKQIAAMDFGPECTILARRTRPGYLDLKIGFRGFSFWLRTTDGQFWRPV